MLPDALPQLMDMLLRLPLLEAAQLRELIQHLPDPEAAAEEMVRRGWITQNQFSSLFPDQQQRPTPQVQQRVRQEMMQTQCPSSAAGSRGEGC
jgi:hypothetical protein